MALKGDHFPSPLLFDFFLRSPPFSPHTNQREVLRPSVVSPFFSNGPSPPKPFSSGSALPTSFPPSRPLTLLCRHLPCIFRGVPCHFRGVPFWSPDTSRDLLNYLALGVIFFSHTPCLPFRLTCHPYDFARLDVPPPLSPPLEPRALWNTTLFHTVYFS